jgi:AcrR family transcriptional regulator
MPRRSQEYMDSQRLLFCEAAMTCFRRKGVAATNLTDICEETGLSMGALYKFFDGREALLEGVLQLLLARRNEVLRGKTWANLRAALLRYAEELEQNPFWREFQGIVDWNERLTALRVREGGTILVQLQGQLHRYEAAGEIAPHFDMRRTVKLISVIFDGSLTGVRAAKDLRANDLQVNRSELGAYFDFAVGRVAAVRAGSDAAAAASGKPKAKVQRAPG